MMTLTLLDSTPLPAKASVPAGKTRLEETFAERLGRLENPELQAVGEAILRHPSGQALFTLLDAHSPHLSHLACQHAGFFCTVAQDGVDKGDDLLNALMAMPASQFTNMEALMEHLRTIKNKGGLLIALADILDIWSLETITEHIAALAEGCLKLAADWLLLDAKKRGDLPRINPDRPSEDCGWIILGMGKLGALELNYSSDIDLIVLYDPQSVHYSGRQTAQQCFNRMTRDLVGIMQERTHHGYVFRTDIRLRPDPSSTPPAVTTAAAISYYESVGQNWERAAMIKARPVAADVAAGEAFLTALTPFLWRRFLDFASIADIHSIKRQIDHRVKTTGNLLGHNLKLGLGGIREIEFYVQVQQLIWGGRNPELRGRNTCTMLQALARAEIIEPIAADELVESYHFLRRLEHRVQMQRDQQHHSLPTTQSELEAFAEFAGYASFETFEAETRAHLRRVRDHYSQLYSVEESLGHEGNLVFTGVEPDPETVETLTRMGFEQPEVICETIMNWHRGHRRAMRNKRAREILTELTPRLLTALSHTIHPDAAFLKFDEFLDKLPAGVQIFSLFEANQELLYLIATIMGSAPRLAEILSRNPHLLDGTLSGAFYDDLPDSPELTERLQTLLAVRREHEDFVNTLCQFKNEYEFQAGIQLIQKMATHDEVAAFLSTLAEVILQAALEHVTTEFAASYGRIEGGQLALIAMGKLGARELTFASDLDLIFVYDAPDAAAMSDGKREVTASVYYNRLCQRFVGLLTSLNREGRLYEVDTRLRPLGSDGPLAAAYSAYDHYFRESAWTFELMALTRARIVSAPQALGQKLEKLIHGNLCRWRDAASVQMDASAMRERIFAQHGSLNPWDIKQTRGGMLDIDFIAQFLQLCHANRKPHILRTSTQHAIQAMRDARILSQKNAALLVDAYGLYSHLLHLLRLCSTGALDEATAPRGLKSLLCSQLNIKNFDHLKTTLITTEESVYNYYQMLMTPEPTGEYP